MIRYLSVKPGVPEDGYWDHEFIKDMFDGLESDRQVVVIPGAYQFDVYDKLNKELAKYDKVLVVITSDEEGKFDISRLEHRDGIYYSQYGNGGKMFPLGYTPGTRETLKKFGIMDKNGWFFSGQITHHRRKLMAEALKEMDYGCLIETDGFAKGINRNDYFLNLATHKVAPCSPGPVSVESFRIYEALEAGCVPLVDEQDPLKSTPSHYYHKLFNQLNFYTFSDFSGFRRLMGESLFDRDINNRVFAWWICYKLAFREQLKRDLGIAQDDLAVIIPSSPIKSHPDTKIIEETIKSIRVHTNSPIYITIDGVRNEQSNMVSNYRDYIRNLLWKINFEYENIYPILFNKHSHQSGMMMAILPAIKAKYILYVEQDTPLTPDCEIPLEELKNRIDSGETNLIRFHFESFIPEPHKYLMIGEPYGGLQKTIQWSQRPHLSSTEYYKKVMSYFSNESNTYIEDLMHSVCQREPWEQHKLTIYHPEGSIKRSYHLDGRDGEEKFDDRLVY